MTPPSTATAVIPARYASTRFPGKMLADATGRPLVCHVVEAVLRARLIGEVIVATDDDRIAAAASRAGAQAVMTRGDHLNGTSRIAEVVETHGERLADRIVNVQGDEPEIDPALIDLLVERLDGDPDVEMATLASPFVPGENVADPNITKVVCDVEGRALYFSRTAIPFDRDGVGVTVLKHAGLYAYRTPFVLRYARWPPTPLEAAEKLEQLRVLEHGCRIAVATAAIQHHGIDTPEQYAEFVARFRGQQGDGGHGTGGGKGRDASWGRS